MKEFIDETSTVDGTPINRASLMAMQGFIGSQTVSYIDEDGYETIKETNEKGEILITRKDEDGNYEQIFVGEKTITKYIALFEDGTVREEIV